MAAVSAAAMLCCATAAGAEGVVSASMDLQVAIDDAADGDELRIVGGRHAGQFVIHRSITLSGEQDALLDGGGRGRVVTVAAPGVVVRGLTVINSGISLAREDAGIFVTEAGDDALIAGNRLQDNLIGVYLKGPQRARVEGNRVIGRRDLRMNERGNGIHLWNTPGSVVADNEVRFGRDGIFVTTSRDNVFRDNRFRDLRFAIHYMYTNHSEVSGNLSQGNHMGYALMYSHQLQVYRNVSQGDRDRGILLNYANDSEVRGNWVLPGPEKCVFIYNANFNTIADNHFEGCEIGIHFTAGSERNELFENAFIDSRTQVKYVGTRIVEWSRAGRGNYWSDNLAIDLNGDGIGDKPYRPNNLVDQVVWRFPLSKLLLNSPAWHLLSWAQSRFPALHPGGVIDRAPLMSPPDAVVPEG